MEGRLKVKLNAPNCSGNYDWAALQVYNCTRYNIS